MVKSKLVVPADYDWKRLEQQMEMASLDYISLGKVRHGKQAHAGEGSQCLTTLSPTNEHHVSGAVSLPGHPVRLHSQQREVLLVHADWLAPRETSAV